MATQVPSFAFSTGEAETESQDRQKVGEVLQVRQGEVQGEVLTQFDPLRLVPEGQAVRQLRLLLYSPKEHDIHPELRLESHDAQVK